MRSFIRRTHIGVLGLGLAGLAACAQAPRTRTPPAAPAQGLPQARVFLIGDAGVVSFQEAEVPEQAQKAEERVEERRPSLPRLPAWARPPGGEKKVFKDIVTEAIGLAVKNARENHLLQTLKGEALNRRFLAPGAVPLIVWLGDNVYETGVPRDPGEEGYKNGELTPHGLDYVQAAATIVVQAQVAVEGKASSIFVAGNHDWNSAVSRGPEGRERVIEEGEVIRRYVEERRAAGALAAGTDIRLLPSGGCPGPVETHLPIGSAAQVKVVAVDTEWLLTKEPDKGCVTGGKCKPCDPATADGVFEQLRSLSRSAKPKDALLVVGHHPVVTYGQHGSQLFWDPKSWIRWLPLSQEDASHPRNGAMRRGLRSAWSAENGQPLLYAAGHDHNLQVIDLEKGGPYQVVSGSASKEGSVRRGPGSLFAESQHGYMVADFFENGRVLLYVVEVAVDGKIRRLPPFELRPAA